MTTQSALVVATSGLFNPDHYGPNGPRMAYNARMKAMQQNEELARSRLPGQDLVTRDLFPSDLGLTNEEWTETSGVDNSLTPTTIAGGATFTVAEDKYCVIVGIRNFTPAVVTPIVVEFDIHVGGKMVAKWNLLQSWYIQDPDAAEAKNFVPISLLAYQPIFVPSQFAIKVDEYNNVATTAYKIAFEGYVTEKVGKKLNV